MGDERGDGVDGERAGHGRQRHRFLAPAKRLVKLLIALVFFEEWPFSFLSFTHLLALGLPGQSVKPLHWTFKALSLICSPIVADNCPS